MCHRLMPPETNLQQGESISLTPVCAFRDAWSLAHYPRASPRPVACANSALSCLCSLPLPCEPPRLSSQMRTPATAGERGPSPAPLFAQNSTRKNVSRASRILLLTSAFHRSQLFRCRWRDDQHFPTCAQPKVFLGTPLFTRQVPLPRHVNQPLQGTALLRLKKLSRRCPLPCRPL